MSKYFHLTVKEIVRETDDTITIHFWHPPHQAISYKPGQFLTLMPTVDGKKVRRAYSMSSSPNKDASLAVTVKRLPGGLVSNYLLDRLRPGDALEVMEPMGHFVCEPNPTRRRQVVMFGAGSGITPLMSMLKSVLPVETGTRIFLIYGSRNENSIIFKQQLADLQEKYGDRFVVRHVLSQPQSWQREAGRLNQGKAIELLGELGVDVPQAEFYVCGPEGLMHEVQGALAVLGVPKERIHKESFAPTHETHGEVVEEDDGGSLKTQTVTVIYEGAEYKVDVAPHQTILEAALELDIDLPYSCQAGMCTACMGRCTAGKVQLDEEDGLTDAELKAGFILTCVAHPLTKDVVVEIE
jgi:ring-1,2-phenylacetyl-CoA epoxidase subunit PaaE